MPTATVTVRLDAEEKRIAEELFANMGLSLSTAYRMFTKAAIRERRMPIEIKEAPRPLYGEEYRHMLDGRIAAAERGESEPHDLIEA
jgi:DNA-damage-inducible protein J